ncbi:MAG TPA: translocation/assembly module TamB domain-containing protein, partial [Thermoanaerobaculia bacterium]
MTPNGKQLGIDANARWSHLAWPLQGTPTVESAQGSAKVSGSLDRYRLELQADLAGGPAAPPSVRPGRFALAGEGDLNHFQLAKLEGDVLGGHVAAHGDVAWKPAVRWDLALAAQGFDPAVFRPDLPGRIDFAASTSGTLRSDGPAGTLDLQRLQGTLRQQALQGSANVALAGKSADVKHLDIKWGEAHLAASGRVGTGGPDAAANLAFDLEDPNLGLVLPGSAGAVVAKGHISGALQTPRVQATVTGQGLRYNDQSVSDLRVTADVDLAPRGTFVLDVQADGVAVGGQTLRQATLSGRGTIESHALRTTLQGLGDDKDSRLDLAVHGGLAGGLSAAAVWRGQIDTFAFKMKPLDPWKLSAPVAVAASAKRAELGKMCLTSGPGTLGAQGSWATAGPWAGSATLDKLPIQELAFLLPKNVSVTGDLNGTFQANGTAKGIVGARFNLTPSPGDVRFPGDEGRVATFHYENLSLVGRADAQGGNATLALTLRDIGQIGGQVELPRLTQGIPLKNQPLQGKVSADVNSLRFLHAFTPDVTNLGGALSARFDLGGTLGEPRLRGQAKLTGGQATLAAFGLNFKNIGLTATGDGSGSVALQASIRSGDGTVTVDGKTGLVPSPATPLHLAIRGRSFQAMDTDEIKVQVSPDLTLDYQGTLAKLAGDVAVPYARIHIEDQKKEPSVVGVSKDVVLVNAPPGPAATSASRLAVSARVRVTLDPTYLQVTAFGLDAKPQGSILLAQEPGRAATGSGEIELQPGGTV